MEQGERRMTKEELEKEADNWLRKYLLCYNCKRKCTCIQLNAYCEEQVLKSYIASAEPREKRIAELIALINSERERQEKCDDVHLRKIADLEKENAELKEAINHFNPCGEWNDDVHDCEFRHYAMEYGSKLTKAKDHIKKLLDCLKQDTNDPQTNYYVCQYMDKAEQFLSEVEK